MASGGHKTPDQESKRGCTLEGHLDSGLAFAPVWRPSGLTCWLFGLRAGLCASLEAGSFVMPVVALSDSGWKRLKV